MHKEQILVQAWVPEIEAKKFDAIAHAARVKRPELIRVMLTDFIERFEEKNGEVSLEASVTLPGQD